MADSIAQLARIANGWVVAVAGGEVFYEKLEDALKAVEDGANLYQKVRAKAEEEAGRSVLTPKEFARSIEPGRRR